MLANNITERDVNPTAPAHENLQLFSREDAAAYLGITTRYLDNLIRAKSIAVTRIGSRVLLSYGSLVRFIEQNTDRHAVSA